LTLPRIHPAKPVERQFQREEFLRLPVRKHGGAIHIDGVVA
jgi:hypothetical protein